VRYPAEYPSVASVCEPGHFNDEKGKISAPGRDNAPASKNPETFGDDFPGTISDSDIILPV